MTRARWSTYLTRVLQEWSPRPIGSSVQHTALRQNYQADCGAKQLQGRHPVRKSQIQEAWGRRFGPQAPYRVRDDERSLTHRRVDPRGVRKAVRRAGHATVASMS